VIERFGIRLDLSARRAWRDENEIPLTAKEFALLELLMMNPDKVLTRETISERLWDTNFEPKSNVIESFVKFLRQKIDRGYNARLIHTVRGAGYRFSDHE
jgi:DNA-binding response OmpR family regulator